MCGSGAITGDTEIAIVVQCKGGKGRGAKGRGKEGKKKGRQAGIRVAGLIPAKDVYGHAPDNVHRQRSFMGYCDNVPAGQHKVPRPSIILHSVGSVSRDAVQHVATRF